MSTEIYQSMLQEKGKAYRDDQIKSYSHYSDPIDTTHGRAAGNSRIWGDASPEVQSRVIDALIVASERAGLNTRQTAHVLAIARIESGFNPDAAAGTTSAYGLGQFIDGTGSHYGIDDASRNSLSKQSEALVAHYFDNSKIARARDQGEEYIYKYHHDGPTKDYGGLALSNSEVMPFIDRYEKFVLAHSVGQTNKLNLHEEPFVKEHKDSIQQTRHGSPISYGVLKKEERDFEVEHVQELLNKFGYRDGKGHLLKQDGDFGQKTKEAVQAFQQAHGLNDDGIVGAKTLDALKRAEQSPLLSNPSHPDHSFYTQALAGIEKLPPGSFKNDQERQNAAASLAFEAKVSGIRQIDNVALSANGTGLFAVQGAMNDPAHHRIHVDKNQAASEPIEKSTAQIQQESISIAPAQQMEREQRQMRMA